MSFGCCFLDTGARVAWRSRRIYSGKTFTHIFCFDFQVLSTFSSLFLYLKSLIKKCSSNAFLLVFIFTVNTIRLSLGMPRTKEPIAAAIDALLQPQRTVEQAHQKMKKKYMQMNVNHKQAAIL